SRSIESVAPTEHSVAAARAEILSDSRALPSEPVAIEAANGRTLAQPVIAARAQPPFRAAAMDGYGIRAADLGAGPLTVLGGAAAGRSHPGAALRAGAAVRIFTGAPVPPGVDLVVPQERARREGDALWLDVGERQRSNIRESGVDFAAGEVLVRSGVR